MNNSSTYSPGQSGGFLAGDDSLGGFGYGVGVSIGILILITTITLASYFCTRNNNASATQGSGAGQRGDHQESQEAAAVVLDIGLDDATIKSYPKLLYSNAKLDKSNPGSTATCCSICLIDYKANHVLRELPECGHLFHAKCIDPWLRLHATCPVCRTSPIPTPLSTPLAEVVPLASRRD